MSSSSAVPIPARKAVPGASTSSSYSSMSSSSFPGSETSSSPAVTPASASSKGKARATESSPSVKQIAPRRPSLLGDSLSKSEYTVINLAHSDGPPRLVTCVKSSQGFDWNQDLFLPSYANHDDGHSLEHKPDPVEEIVLTDEEAEAMLP